jgi:serine protease
VRGASSFVLSSHGGIDGIEVTTGAPKVYVVFYGSQWGTESTNSSGYASFRGDPTGLAPRAQALRAGIGTNNELWSGVWYDNSVASPSQATGHQLATEAVAAAAHFTNTTAPSNRSA